MGALALEGSLLAGPPGCGGTFPTASLAEQLALYTSPKPYQAATGVLSRTVNSPAAFVPLNALGVAGDVTQCDFLYLKSDGPLILRMVQDDGSGSGTITYDMPIQGLVLLEFPSAQPLLGISVKGTARIAYLLSGPA